MLRVLESHQDLEDDSVKVRLNVSKLSPIPNFLRHLRPKFGRLTKPKCRMPVVIQFAGNRKPKDIGKNINIPLENLESF